MKRTIVLMFGMSSFFTMSFAMMKQESVKMLDGWPRVQSSTPPIPIPARSSLDPQDWDPQDVEAVGQPIQRFCLTREEVGKWFDYLKNHDQTIANMPLSAITNVISTVTTFFLQHPDYLDCVGYHYPRQIQGMVEKIDPAFKLMKTAFCGVHRLIELLENNGLHQQPDFIKAIILREVFWITIDSWCENISYDINEPLLKKMAECNRQQKIKVLTEEQIASIKKPAVGGHKNFFQRGL
jgi:hypothetical protein